MLRRATAAVLVATALTVGLASPAEARHDGARQDGAWQAGFSTTDVDIPTSGGVRLASQVFEPRRPGPHPFAIIISAWGGGRTQNQFPARYLAARGYVVVTYGTRGFGESTGEVQVAGPDDITDVSAVIDWGLANTAADPDRIGVSGVSYGAGIALIASAKDARIDAVASTSGWSDLVASLNTNDTRHGAVGAVLHESGRRNGRLSPESDRMLSMYRQPLLSEADGQAIIDWSIPRSPITYLDEINANDVAVLNVQTWSETVFPPGQMVDLYERLTGPKRAEFVPGDHASTEYGGLLGLPSDTWRSVYRWFDAHVAGTDTSIADEPPIQIRTRPGIGPFEGYARWSDVLGTPERFYLGRSRHRDGRLTTTRPPGWSASVASNRDTVANGGVPLVTYSLEAFTGNPPTAFLSLVDRSVGVVFTGPVAREPVRIRGSMRTRLTVVPATATGTVVVYVYDVLLGEVGSLINYVPYTWENAEPGRPITFEVAFEPTAYTVAAGHRLALVVDAKDPLFLDQNFGDGRIGLTSPPDDPAWLDVPTVPKGGTP